MSQHLKKLDVDLICLNKNSDVHFLLESIGIEKLSKYGWSNLSENKHAIPFLEHITQNFTTNLDKLDWKELSKNENAIHIVSRPEFRDRIDLSYLVLNKNAIDLLKQILYAMKIDDISDTDWRNLCLKPHGVQLLEHLTCNFTKHLNKIDWTLLSGNENAVVWLSKFIHLCDIQMLCENKNATNLIEQFILTSPEKFNDECWISLIKNPNAFQLFNKHKDKLWDKISWYSLCWNKSIVEFDHIQYNFLKHKLSNHIYEL
jgi:hypothetical protein